MYKIAILYDFIWYNYFYNTIKYEEAKGNVEIVGIGVDTPYALTLDGREIKRVEDILLGEWDYLICAVGDREFGIPCFDFLEYVEMKARRPTIIANHCWGALPIMNCG